jgi:hypothetical protein
MTLDELMNVSAVSYEKVSHELQKNSSRQPGLEGAK